MQVLIKPVLTEKMTEIGEKLQQYAFIVDKRANKNQISEAIEKMYSVNVETVRTMNYGGRKKSRFTKAGVITGKTNSYKKAVVKLKDGAIIDFYNNI